MRLLEFASVKLSLFLILGILMGHHFQPHVIPIAVLLFILIICLAWSKKMQKRKAFPHFGVLTSMTATVLGIFILSTGLPQNQPNHFINDFNTENSWQLKVTETLKPNAYSHRYYAEVQSVSNKTSSGNLILYVPRESLSETLSVGDQLLTRAKITSPRPPQNPHQFNFKAYLQKQGIYGQLHLKPGQWVSLNRSSWTFFERAANFRENLIKKLQRQGFGKQQFGVIQALLLGQRNDISEETYTNYRNAGAVHILAVSGLHVGILLLLLQFLLRPLELLPKGRAIKLIIIVLLLWGYAFVAGLSPSIVRAVTMFSFLAYALHLNRPTNTFNILALSLFFILLIRPLFLFQVGFQMSYAAVFAIVWTYPKLQGFWLPKPWLVRKIWQLFSVSIAAQLGVLPLSLFYFHQFPGLFFISNLIIVPFLGIILGAGIVVLVLTYFDLLPIVIVNLYNSTIQGMNEVIGWVAQQEVFLFKDIPFDTIQLLIAYAIILALVLGLSKVNYRNIAFLLSSIAVFSGYLVLSQWHFSTKEALILAHQTKNTILLHRQGNTLKVMTRKPDSNLTLVKNYSLGERIETVKYSTLLNRYRMGDKTLFIIDSLGIYPSSPAVDVVLLSHSPRIHLNRLIDSLKPQLILVDGSNYKSYIRRWQQTCLKRKLPFHYTGEKGAYFFRLQNQ